MVAVGVGDDDLANGARIMSQGVQVVHQPFGIGTGVKKQGASIRLHQTGKSPSRTQTGGFGFPVEKHGELFG